MYNISLKLEEESNNYTTLIINYLGIQLMVPKGYFLESSYIAIDDDGSIGFYKSKPSYNESRGMWKCLSSSDSYTCIGFLDTFNFNVFGLTPLDFRKASKAILLEYLIPIKDLYIGRVSTARISSQINLIKE